MNYSALIEARHSVRGFTYKRVSPADLAELEVYFHHKALRLIPELKTDLLVFGDSAREALEGAAGYHQFLVGAPQYLVLLSQADPLAHLNGGFLMEDLILKLTDMELDTCWLTFTDSDRVKDALGIETDMEVVAIAAFGYGVRTRRRPRINILSMSNVDIKAKRHYVEPKRNVRDMAFLDSWGNSHGLDSTIGFFDDMLWEALYAASLSPSYLNRQAYGFVLHNGFVSLVRRPDEYDNEIDGMLSLGAALLHFTAVASSWAGAVRWTFGEEQPPLELPEGHTQIASCLL